LVMDDAPGLVVTGMNEGRVPSSLNADLFLPNQLRRALGIEDNERRYARDAYALSALAASQPDLALVLGRRTVEGDPLLPSRLLFACDDETLLRRARRFFASHEANALQPMLPGQPRPGREQSGFEPPRPEPLEQPVPWMRVTEFRDYLACPYRYYLRHRLGLKPLDDTAEELDAAAFGSLAHEVLRRFGADPIARSTDTDEIRDFLDKALARIVEEQYGRMPLAAIRIQVAQLRHRLSAFATWQAEWAQQGWRIERVEAAPEEGRAALIVDGKPMVLHGRIDRIDRNENDGRRIVFDYKTSDSAVSPEKKHQKGDKWTDLQLPLYRHLLRGMGIEGPAELGYINLPKDTSQVGKKLAEWTEEDLLSADREAEWVVRQIRDEVFWPKQEPPPAFSEPFAAICMDGQFSALAADEEGDAP